MTATPLKRALEENTIKRTQRNIRLNLTKDTEAKAKSYKRKVFLESSTESEVKNICDGDSDDDMD